VNIKEGMRRVGILLGVAGGLFGGVLAYLEGQSLWNARAAHLRFESVMASPTMQQITKAAALRPVSRFGGIAVECVVPDFDSRAASLTARQRSSFGDLAATESANDDGTCDVLRGHPLLDGNHDGINAVHINADKTVSSVKLSTGELVKRTESPQLKVYLSLFLYPVVGFLLPWGCMRLLAWVGAGFVTPLR
jgi:hypothetical protein